MDLSPPRTVCRDCGTTLATAVKGIEPFCPACLLAAALGDEPPAEARSGNDPTARPPADAGCPAGERFAHYTLACRDDGSLVELGRGGMGVTYRARDETLGCDVALKVIHPEWGQDGRVRARFLREARAAAGLRHRHVASVFFFGERAEDGQLFYAMELVEGETLAERVCRCGGLPANQVLELGRQVADALAAAAGRGLTHRDLKPGNLMLAGEGATNVKLIDFGLAKAVAEEGGDGPHLTRTQEFVGTPAFASPEQWSVWQDSDARSDFYALGATLWYALTGQPPFAGRTPQEIQVRQLRADLPLARLRAARVPRPVVALLRCLLAADPAGRPQTAGELADALTRCQQTPAKRRRWAVGLATAGVVGLLALGAWMAAHHAAGRLARQNARLQRQTSAQQQQLDALQSQLQRQTQLIALVNAKIDRNAAPGGTSLAAAQVEAARQRGVDVDTLRQQLAGEQADVRALLAQIDQGLTAAQADADQWRGLKRAALVRQGDGEFAAGHYAPAVESYRQALVLVDADREESVWHDATEGLVRSLLASARYAEAAPLVQGMVDRLTTLQGAEGPDTLKAMRDQARLLYEQGDLPASEALYRRVLAAQERTLGKEDRETLRTLNGLSNLPGDQGRLAEAEDLGRRCVEACERTLGQDDLLTLESLNNLAYTLHDEGKFAEDAALMHRVLATRERLLGADHPLTVMTANNLASTLNAQGDQPAAEALLRHTLAAAERTLGPEHPSTVRVVNNLARVLRSEGDLAEAVSLYRRAVEGHEHAQGPEHRDTLISLNNLADALITQGNMTEAEPLLRQALASAERTLGPENPITLQIVNNLAAVMQAKGDYAAEETLLRRDLAGSERVNGPDHPDTLSALSSLAQLFDAKGDLLAAEGLYQQAQEKMERLLPPSHEYRLDQEHHFSLFREQQGRLAEALALAAQAVEGSRKMTASSDLRRTYEEHFQALQAKVTATPAPPPSPAGRTDPAR